MNKVWNIPCSICRGLKPSVAYSGPKCNRWLQPPAKLERRIAIRTLSKSRDAFGTY